MLDVQLNLPHTSIKIKTDSLFSEAYAKHTSGELTILIFPKKWFRYPCIAIFALSDIECCLPRAGRIIGRAALDGTSLNQKPTYKQL